EVDDVDREPEPVVRGAGDRRGGAAHTHVALAVVPADVAVRAGPGRARLVALQEELALLADRAVPAAHGEQDAGLLQRLLPGGVPGVGGVGAQVRVRLAGQRLAELLREVAVAVRDALV